MIASLEREKGGPLRVRESRQSCARLRPLRVSGVLCGSCVQDHRLPQYYHPHPRRVERGDTTTCQASGDEIWAWIWVVDPVRKVLWDPPVVARVCGLPPSLLPRGWVTRLPLPSGTLHRHTYRRL